MQGMSERDYAARASLRAGKMARRLAWPFSYVTTGQNVPEDIEPAHAARLAQWVLGNKQ